MGALRLAALAEKADIRPSHVGPIERSPRNPGLEVCKALADGLGLPPAQMVAEAEQGCRKRR
jgi:transcriptional regulator with XRE-family HTH domain